MISQLYLRRCGAFVNLKRYEDIFLHIIGKPTRYKRERAVDHHMNIKLRSEVKRRVKKKITSLPRWIVFHCYNSAFALIGAHKTAS